MVEQLDDVADVVERLLADPEDLKRHQALARAQARQHTDWHAFVGRVGDAISAIESEQERPDAPWREVAGLLAVRLLG
jgi:hypothetical protein